MCNKIDYSPTTISALVSLFFLQVSEHFYFTIFNSNRFYNFAYGSNNYNNDKTMFEVYNLLLYLKLYKRLTRIIL